MSVNAGLRQGLKSLQERLLFLLEIPVVHSGESGGHAAAPAVLSVSSGTSSPVPTAPDGEMMLITPQEEKAAAEDSHPRLPRLRLAAVQACVR